MDERFEALPNKTGNGTIVLTRDDMGVAAVLQAAFSRIGMTAGVLETNEVLDRVPHDLCALVIIPPKLDTGQPSPPDTRFLKNAFLLAQKCHPLLQKRADQGDTPFMATLSFMGGDLGFNADAIAHPLTGGLSGLSKTADVEWPDILCKAVDLQADINFISAHANDLVRIIASKGPVECGLTPSGIAVPKTVPAPFNTTADFTLTQEDVILITGGARGVTAQCALELAEAFSPTLILLGRTPQPEREPDWLRPLQTEKEIKKEWLIHAGPHDKPTPLALQAAYEKIQANREIQHNIKAMASRGARVFYRCLDIREPESFLSVLKEITAQTGPVTAVIHGAGVIRDRYIIDKTEGQFDQVFDTKVMGLFNLLDACPPSSLKSLVLFSSVAARTGNAGQADYAMANEVLNKMAREVTVHFPGCRTLSLNWGPWEGGMVTPALQKKFLEKNISLIPIKAGAETLVQALLYADPAHVEMVVGGGAVEPLTRAEDGDSTEPHALPRDQLAARASQPLFSTDKILAFAVGNPSEAFGPRYSAFDMDREIARLPGPPFCFIDDVIRADHPAFQMTPGGWIETRFDMNRDGWFFNAGKTDFLPFCILLEAALQPCGWLAAYAGSALQSEDRLYFRNLGGRAVLHDAVYRYVPGKLAVKCRMTHVSKAGGLIIQDYDIIMSRRGKIVYEGTTQFGFFTRSSLSGQRGISDLEIEPVSWDSRNSGSCAITFKTEPPITPSDHRPFTPGPIPATALRMVDIIRHHDPEGGRYGLGLICGEKKIHPEEWFFKAHFFQDPVCPGSLGIESFLQVLTFHGYKIWELDPHIYEGIACAQEHQWRYRGQVTPDSEKMVVQVHVKTRHPETKTLKADAILLVDGLVIYEMMDFSVSFKTRQKNSNTQD